MANRVDGKRGYLAESGRNLGLGVPGCVRLKYCCGLLAACLPAIFKVTESEKVENIRQSVDVGASGRVRVPKPGLLVTILRNTASVENKEGRERSCNLRRRVVGPGCSEGWQPYSDKTGA